MKNATQHVHGNVKIKLINFLSFFFTSILLSIFKFFFPSVDKKFNDVLISRATYAPWKFNKKFISIYSKIKHLTLLDKPRLYTFYFLTSQIKKANGDILDIGCMKGGVGILMSFLNLKGRIMLFDTFEGFLDKENLHKDNIFKYEGYGELKDLIKKLKLKKTKVYKKYFPVNIDQLKIKKIKLCHIDVNTYKSTKSSYEFVKDKIVNNGIIVFDDYGMHGVENVTRFINGIIKKDKKKFKFILNYFGQCILIKN